LLRAPGDIGCPLPTLEPLRVMGLTTSLMGMGVAPWCFQSSDKFWTNLCYAQWGFDATAIAIK
jgi:hypothetical protein